MLKRKDTSKLSSQCNNYTLIISRFSTNKIFFFGSQLLLTVQSITLEDLPFLSHIRYPTNTLSQLG